MVVEQSSCGVARGPYFDRTGHDRVQRTIEFAHSPSCFNYRIEVRQITRDGGRRSAGPSTRLARCLQVTCEADDVRSTACKRTTSLKADAGIATCNEYRAARQIESCKNIDRR
jgi:hypothetical protein